MKENIDKDFLTKEAISKSVYGCRNCLWKGVECKDQEKLKPIIAGNKPSCEGYTYYD